MSDSNRLPPQGEQNVERAVSAGAQFPQESWQVWRHAWIGAGFVTLLGAMIYTTSERLQEYSRQNDKADRREIVGSVQYQGQPLARGKIVFRCQIVASDQEFTDAEGSIINGVFRIPRHLGPCPGLYLIDVTPDSHRGDFSPADFGPLTPRVKMYTDAESVVIRAKASQSILVNVHNGRVNRYDLQLD